MIFEAVIMELGYCCLSATLRERKPSVFTNRTCIKKTFLEKGLEYVSKLALLNVKDLLVVVQWNEEQGIRLFRLSSEILPWWTEYKLEDLPDAEDIRAGFEAVGQFARERGHRLTYHPGPYVVLASPKDDVARKSLYELEQHSKIMDWMGFKPSFFNKINIHIRATYGDKQAAMDRFVQRWHQLSDNCKARLTVENDDTPNAYSVDDLLYVHEKIKIPIVFDRHHVRFCRGNMSEQEAFEAAIATWPEGIRPIVHWSESQIGRKPLAHSDYIEGPVAFWGREADVDCHLECKQKDKALLRYRQKIGT
jgi:UV DNA damage endonuclease